MSSVSNNTYKAQEKVAFWGTVFEIPSVIIFAIYSFLTASPLVIIDFLDSFSYILHTGLVWIISRTLKKDTHFEYNYGTERIEAIVSLLCDILLCIGALCVATLSIYDLIHPVFQSKLLIWVVVLKLVEVIIDIVLFNQQAKIYKNEKNPITRTEYFSTLKDVIFESVSLLLFAICFVFRDSIFTTYFSSIAALLICAWFLFGRIKDFKLRISDLTDKTLNEEQQLLVIKILNKYDAQYNMFYSVKSHKIDEKTFIDFYIDFAPETSFSEIKTLEELLQKEMISVIDNCNVSIVISGEQNN